MKTVAKINPEKEYEIARNMIELASKAILDSGQVGTLGSSVDNLITAARVLMEREERRRGKPLIKPKNPNPKEIKKKLREDFNKLPSKRYPDIEIQEVTLSEEHPPVCHCCQNVMKESGLFEVSEKLEIVPKKYFIERTKRVKYNCSKCYGAIVTTPPLPSIIPTSNYGDSLIIDVTLSKFSDLIPIERYVQMALQMGLNGDLPPQSLIGCTHHFSNFLDVVYQAIKLEVQSSLVLMADETGLKMLEGDETNNWFLWIFVSSKGCYFESHDTRSGDVACEFLKNSQAEVLLTDAYGGYGKALRAIKSQTGRDIKEAHCNAHAYRYFEEASITWKEDVEIFLKLYGEIYELERARKESNSSREDQLVFRTKMTPLFEEMKSHCQKKMPDAMPKSHILTAMNYFLNHYDGLTLCLTNIDIPLDNNTAEGHQRPHVVGRKTWIGTHSKRGAATTAVFFTIVQSCKLLRVNPRVYFNWVVEQIHQEKKALTPYEYLLKVVNEPGTQ